MSVVSRGSSCSWLGDERRPCPPRTTPPSRSRRAARGCRSTGSSARRARDLEHRGDRAEVVVGARARPALRPMSANDAAPPSDRNVPSSPQRSQPEQRAERDEHRRRAKTSRIVPGQTRPRSTCSGNVRAYQRTSVKSKARPGVRGVVVGDEDDRALGVRVARAADDVPRRALGQPARASSGRATARPRPRRRARANAPATRAEQRGGRAARRRRRATLKMPIGHQ